MGKYKNITIDEALGKAKWALAAAHDGTCPDDSGTRPGEGIPTEKRAIFASGGAGWASLALAMQNERDYEERKIKEIREGADGARDTS